MHPETTTWLKLFATYLGAAVTSVGIVAETGLPPLEAACKHFPAF